MNIEYEFLYSGTKIYDGTSITGLLVTDTSSSNTYILQIPLTDFSISEKQAGPFAIDEVYKSSLVMVNAATLFQTKNVNPMLEGQIVQPDAGYVGLAQVNVAAVPVETKTVKSNTTANQTVTPSEGKLGISQVTVQKFDGESGNPEAAYTDGDEIYLKSIPAKFLNYIDRVAEFNGYYKAIVSDNNKSYASAQIIYADESFGPRIPMFDLIGKAEMTDSPSPSPTPSASSCNRT